MISLFSLFILFHFHIVPFDPLLLFPSFSHSSPSPLNPSPTNPSPYSSRPLDLHSIFPPASPLYFSTIPIPISSTFIPIFPTFPLFLLYTRPITPDPLLSVQYHLSSQPPHPLTSIVIPSTENLSFSSCITSPTHPNYINPQPTPHLTLITPLKPEGFPSYFPTVVFSSKDKTIQYTCSTIEAFNLCSQKI